MSRRHSLGRLLPLLLKGRNLPLQQLAMRKSFWLVTNTAPRKLSDT
ncbi:unnamed protein product [Cyprideis torosa]|uniref:Uncharacterized protein n=1 Tax=Cyprideis torosa TaxID=163714 RepID=A0A7R8WNR0_9CRUS|nr:unnamed protein product [Cyprideis torosa]CAG0906536.1 unnamed protein product [Cyprideis torosa]